MFEYIMKPDLTTHMLESASSTTLNTSDDFKALRLTTSTCALPNKEVGRCGAKKVKTVSPELRQLTNSAGAVHVRVYHEAGFDNTHARERIYARERIEHDSQHFRRLQICSFDNFDMCFAKQRNGSLQRLGVSPELRQITKSAGAVHVRVYHEAGFDNTHARERIEHDSQHFRQLLYTTSQHVFECARLT